jgi:uncharacterized protein (DUF2141 family)
MFVLRDFKPAIGRAGPLMYLPLTLAVVSAASPAAALTEHELCRGEPTRIDVVVDGLRSTKGDIVVEIYPDDEKQFLVPKAQTNSIHIKLESSPQSVCLPVPKAGGYAVAVFHDENADREFNRNILGIPTEGFGLSNNPPVHLSMPAFQSVRFEAGEGETTVHVHMHYVLGGKVPN